MMRNIFGWDLPPGVSTRDLPGNTDQDREADRAVAFEDALYDKCREVFSQPPDALVIEWLWKQMGEAYSEGYQQGVSDEAYANDCKKA
jgi:hypothetical protein